MLLAMHKAITGVGIGGLVAVTGLLVEMVGMVPEPLPPSPAVGLSPLKVGDVRVGVGGMTVDGRIPEPELTSPTFPPSPPTAKNSMQVNPGLHLSCSHLVAGTQVACAKSPSS